MGYLFAETAEGDEAAKKIRNFVILEITCWALGTISSIVLIWAILYTVYMLRILYPGQGYSETSRIFWIAMIFIFSMVTKSTFQWVMFYYHHEVDTPVVHDMLLIQCVAMPILWDVFPICTIFYLH